jgi:hypothetical protein
MEVEEKDCSSQPTARAGEGATEAHSELPEALLITFAIAGSSAGAIGGPLFSKLYLNSFSPAFFSTLGCMLGCVVMCTVGYYCWRLFRSAKVTELNLVAFVSDEKRMEKEIHTSGNYC